MANKPSRFRSSSAEKRHKQDTQAYVVYVVISIVGLIAWLWNGVHEIAVGALQGAIAPLVILMLRYVFRVVKKQRMDPTGMLTAVLFIVASIVVIVFCYPHSLWQVFILLLAIVATVFGVQHFRLSPLFMLLNCMVAGAILL